MKLLKQVEIILISILFIIYGIFATISPHKITEDGTFISSPFLIIIAFVFCIKGMVHYMIELYYFLEYINKKILNKLDSK